jgi:uncharacterized protein YcnI
MSHSYISIRRSLFLAALVLTVPSLVMAHVSVRPRESKPDTTMAGSITVIGTLAPN